MNVNKGNFTIILQSSLTCSNQHVFNRQHARYALFYLIILSHHSHDEHHMIITKYVGMGKTIVWCCTQSVVYSNHCSADRAWELYLGGSTWVVVGTSAGRVQQTGLDSLVAGNGTHTVWKDHKRVNSLIPAENIYNTKDKNCSGWKEKYEKKKDNNKKKPFVSVEIHQQ